MNKRLVKTLEKVVNRRGKEEVLFLDAYNGNFSAETFGTILTGIDYRCMHFIMEYEREDTDRCKLQGRQGG